MLGPRIVFAALLLVPAVAAAQRGGGGGAGGTSEASSRRDSRAHFDEVEKGTKPGLQLSNGDLEDISPIKLLVDKRKALKLSDDQTRQIKEIDGTLKAKNAPLFKTMDSLRIELKPRSGTPNEADRLRMTMARNDVSVVVKSIRGNYDAALTQAIPLLDATQLQAAHDLIAKQTKEAETMLLDRLGGRG